jgi:endo-1,4-beta-xylanase
MNFVRYMSNHPTSYRGLSLVPLLLAIVLNGCSQDQKLTPDYSKGLKDYYRDYFTIGVAVMPSSLEGEEGALVKKHFGSLTAENVMKMGPIHPKEDTYNWDPADKIVDFAQANGMKMRGHALCWHNQAPTWLFVDGNGKPSKEVLLKRLKDHITAVVTRYKGKVYAWDVVNEAIADEDSKFLRDSDWSAICGEEFIMKAFEYAHEADPNALLFYNDYNTEQPVKREKIYNLIKKMLDAKVPIHGVGLQGHWSIIDPSSTELANSIEKFASLGIQVQITELDVSVYEWGKTETAGFTAEREQKQISQYKMIFEVLRKYKASITGVTFWNVSDKYSWLDKFPVAGRKNYPLLFDESLKPKKAYWEVVKF